MQQQKKNNLMGFDTIEINLVFFKMDMFTMDVLGYCPYKYNQKKVVFLGF